MEAIVLAGGLGTRLKSKVVDRPKPMAMVAGRPFLEYILRSLEKNGVTRVVLSVGYLHETIQQHFGRRWGGLEVAYAIEESPLGTGGGLRLALDQIRGPSCWILNGDSILEFDFRSAAKEHQTGGADLTIGLRKVPNADRYGTVLLEGRRVKGFREKGAASGEAWINGGIYLARKTLLSAFAPGQKFSFEGDFLEKSVADLIVYGFPSGGFFIDIGVPEDFERAQREPYFKEMFK